MNTSAITIKGHSLTVATRYGQTHYTGIAEAGRGQKATVALAKKLAESITGEKLAWRLRGHHCGVPSAKLADGRLVYAAAIHPQMGELSFSYRTSAGWIPEVSVDLEVAR